MRTRLVWWKRLWRWFRLLFAKIISGQNEIELICSHRNGPESSVQLRSALFFSDDMGRPIHDLLCQFKPFDVSLISYKFTRLEYKLGTLHVQNTCGEGKSYLG